VHYVPLRKDLSNLDEPFAKFRDPDYGACVREQAHELVRAELTYSKLIDRFHAELAPLLGW
jgi:hypothetical protein